VSQVPTPRPVACLLPSPIGYYHQVEPCMLAHSHGWKMCPFVHPGEPVKRRHPSTHRGDLCNIVKKVGAPACNMQ
jgi:hypothetical protein